MQLMTNFIFSIRLFSVFKCNITTENNPAMKHATVFVLLIFIATKLCSQDRLSGKSFSTRSEVIAQHGMACTSHPLATIVAIEILKKGGSAIDAADRGQCSTRRRRA
jgi:hypothetical protein